VRALELEHYSLILAYGPSLAEVYRSMYRLPRVEVFHEGADVDLFQPCRGSRQCDDVLFIGNWGGCDRSAELRTYLLEPARALPGLRFAIYGVRYPPDLVDRLHGEYGIDYRGWLPNFEAPAAYSAAKVTVHVPRRQYAGWLHGIPTIRVFEALACGACLISTPWPDTDGLFRRERDFLTVWTPEHMRDCIAWLCRDEAARRRYGENGRETVLARHTCAHRAQQLVDLVARLR
jgi:spore maturation protein CgeB